MSNKKPDPPKKPDCKRPKDFPVTSVVSDYGPRLIDLANRVAALEAQVAALKE
jgi:hypothetical protein